MQTYDSSLVKNEWFVNIFLFFSYNNFLHRILRMVGVYFGKGYFVVCKGYNRLRKQNIVCKIKKLSRTVLISGRKGPDDIASQEAVRMKTSNFLQLKIYRRTFLIYLLIVTVFFSLIIYNYYIKAQTAGLQAFSQQMNRAFTQVEEEMDSVTETIDNFFTRLYSSPVLKEDFLNFFGAAPAEYAAARLRSSQIAYETYLDTCANLVIDCGHMIRYILYYSAENIICMEYNEAGYSRFRMIGLEESEELCKRGYVYTKDIYLNSVYAGKVSFVLDVSIPVTNAFCRDHNVVWLEVQGQGRAINGMPEADIDVEKLVKSGKWQGRVPSVFGKPEKSFYTVNASDRYSYMVVVVEAADLYMRSVMKEFWILILSLCLVFALITLVCIRRFSLDGHFQQEILRSMESVRTGSFQRIEVGKRNDDYAAIAGHLNGLYQYLETLIRQKYELEISQQRTQMQMLSSQLNPHFLYNTLERIRLRALKAKNLEIAEATANLGLLYRNIVKTEPVITLEKEIEITKQYLELMCFLYDDRFLYHCDVEDELMEVMTPKIWMQPIMENFFKHNFREDDRIKVIVLSGERCQAGVRFSFFDNMGCIREEQLDFLNRHFTPDESRKNEQETGGIGLQNVYYRLWLYYGDKVSMSIRNNAPSGVCIEVLLKGE